MSTRNSKSYKSRKKKRGIWNSTFYRVYFALVAIALLAIILGTMWLRGVLEDYESAQPKYVAEGVGRLFESADYDAIYNVDTSAAQFAGGDEALYLDNLRQLTAGRRVEWTPAFSANKDERRYNVTVDGERFATFTLVPSGQTTPKGNALWKLGSVTTLVELQQATPEPEPEPTPEPEPAVKYACRVTVPQGYAVTVDGEALTADNATTEEKPLFEADFLPPGVKNPALVEYRYDAASENPQVEIADETGAPVEAELVEGRERTWSCPMKSDEAYSDQYGKAAIALGKQVAKFMNKDARKKAIERACAKGSPAEAIFDNLSNTYATPHWGIDFKDEAVSEFYVLADDCFTCRVSFDTVLKTEKGEAVYPTAYTFCVINDGGEGKLWNIKVY